MTLTHFHFDTLESTQDRVFELLEEGQADLLVVSAENQTRGRGRQGREWISEPGRSLTLSIGFKMEARRLEGLSLLVGLATREAIGMNEIELKWPNDLMLRDQKVGGILIESRSRGPEALVAVGIGVNLFSLQSANYHGLGKKIDSLIVANAFESRFRKFSTTGFAPFREEFEKVLWNRNHLVNLKIDGEVRSVKVLGVNERGHLMTENQGVLELTDQGEILATS